MSSKEAPYDPFARKPVAPPKDNLLAPTPAEAGRESFVSDNGNAFRKSNDYLSAFIRGGTAAATNDTKAPAKEIESTVTEVETTPEKEVPPPPIRQEESYNQSREHDRKPSHPNGLPSNPRPQHEPKLPELNLPEISLEKETTPSISVTEHNTQHDSLAAPAPRDNQGRAQADSQYYHSYYDQEPESQGQTRENSYYDQQQYGQRQSDQQYSQRQSDQHYNQQQYDHNSGYNQQDQHNVPQIQAEEYDDGEDYYDPEEEYQDYSQFVEDLGYDPRRLTMGQRPLPPDDPSENPEQRANRIRSFYKEYFDAPNGAYQHDGYYEGDEMYDDYYYEQDYHHQRGYSSTGYRHRGHTFSNGSYAPGPRAFSSASGRYGHPYGRPGPRKPKKKMPPPKALNILPTPSKLKDDTFLLDQAVDFAPPTKAFLQRAGTPDSLRGGKRAYSPSVKAFVPMASSFDDLSVMPSP
jgi:hypothetical protein